MAPAAAKTPAQRKRTRKRKRRAASFSSSSSSSSSSSESDNDEQPPPPKVVPVKKTTASVTPAPAQSGSDSDSSSSSSSSSSDSEEEVSRSNAKNSALRTERTLSARPPSRSPSPIIDAPLPSFLPCKTGPGTPSDSEDQTKAKFRQFWMESIVDGFKDDLETIRKVFSPPTHYRAKFLNDEQEPSFGPSKLALLIDSLASGADVFTSTTTNQGGPSEMDVVLG